MFTPTTLTPMRPSLVVIVAAAALLAAGCSGSDDSADTTIDFSTGTLADSTAPITTSTPTTTTAPTTTTPTTTTTVAPTTTIDPTTQLIADIEADLNAGEQALLSAGADPSNPELRAELERYLSGAALERGLALVDGWAADGFRVRPNPDVMSMFLVYSVSDVDNLDEASRAVIQVCRVDAAVVYEPLPDGREIIVDDGVYRTVGETEVLQVDGIWRANGGTTTEELSGVTSCDP